MKSAGPGQIGPRDSDSRVMEALVCICLAVPDARNDPDIRAAVAVLASMLERTDPNPFVIHSPALIARALKACRLRLPLAAKRKLEALGLREERRSAMAAEQARRLTDLIRIEAIEAWPLRGWSLAEAYYPEPLARHCHALRWLVPDGSAARRLADLIRAEGWQVTCPSPPLAPHKLILAGDGKINVELHRRPLPWTSRVPDPGELKTREFVLAEIIGSALIEGTAATGQWLVDIAQLVRHGEFDAARFAVIVQSFGFSRWAQESLMLVARLASDDEVKLQSGATALQAALGHGEARARDTRQVRDLRALQSLIALPRRQFFARALARPDLILRAHVLRRQRSLRRRHEASIRSDLRQRLVNSRR